MIPTTNHRLSEKGSLRRAPADKNKTHYLFIYPGCDALAELILNTIEPYGGQETTASVKLLRS